MKVWTAVGAAALSVTLGASLLAGPSVAVSGVAHQRKDVVTKVSIKASKARVLATKPVVFRGVAKPGAAGAKVVLQQRLAGKKSWSTADTGKIGRTGRYLLADRPSTPGHRAYRVVVPPFKNHRAGVSRAVALSVYRWLDLTTVKTRSEQATYKQSKVQFDTTKYGPAMVGRSYDEDGYSDWNLERECLTLKARFGLSDESDASAIADISVVADGGSVYSKSFALTESQAATIDISGAFRVSFSWTGSNPEADPETSHYGVVAAMAEPQVLCAFGPRVK